MSDQQTRLEQARHALTRGEASTAISLYLSASQQEPGDPLIFLGLGMAYCQSKEIPQALSAFGKALSLDANNPDIAFAIADALQRAEQTQLAEQVYRNILQNCPEHLHSAHNLGSLLYAEERFAEAIVQYRSALLHYPQSPSLQRDLSQALIASGELAAGIELLEATCQQQEKLTDDEERRLSRFALALAYLRNENWESGWPLYEARWTTAELLQQEQRWGKRWDGSSLTGHHLLIIAEQGYGDSLMFARYIPQLAEEASTITCIVPEPLRIVLERALNQWPNLIVQSLSAPPKQHDYFVFMGSLALYAGHTKRSQPQYRPPPPLQLKPTPTTTNLPPPPCIGLVWRGQSKYSANNQRSIPLRKLLLKLPFFGLSYASLQIDSTDEERLLLENFGICDLGKEIRNFQDTANLVSQLQGLVCVDTSITHLAGNLHKPVLLLQRAEGEWRWGKTKNGTRWYENCYSHKVADLLEHRNLQEIMLKEFARKIEPQ